MTNLLLIDDDPIFRLGLSKALESFPNLHIVAEIDQIQDVSQRLAEFQTNQTLELVILELLFGNPNSDSIPGLSVCEQIKTDYPQLPILLITSDSDPTLLAKAKRLGVEGYCPKGCTIDQIVEGINRLIEGESYWQLLPKQTYSFPSSTWQYQLRESGLRQIQATLDVVNAQLQNSDRSSLDQLFWQGRRRELLAARWLVNQLLPDLVIRPQEWENRQRGEPERKADFNLAIVPKSSAQLNPNSPNFMLSGGIFEKLESGLQNLTDIPLEIDSLRSDKKRNLLYIIGQKFEEILEDLRFSQVTLDQLPETRSRLLQDLWQSSLTDFFGKYSTLPLDKGELVIVDSLLQDAPIVKTAILDKIPLVVDLLANRLFETPLIIDNVPYSAGTPEVLVRSEILLENLIIQVANAVIQPLLNQLSDVEWIKQTFYNERLISSREVAKFRNNLSWKYRRFDLFDEPIAIFESRYDLFIFSDFGIKKISIYSPRRQELEQLEGLSLGVTLAYEIRDAIAPRLRSMIAWVGQGVVYLLTQVLGRGIGLILRGIIQGVGSALQDTRFGKDGER